MIVDKSENEGAGPLRFASAQGAPLEGELRFRAEAFLDASNALDTLLAADRLIAWATAARYRAAARIAETIGAEAPPRRQYQPERFNGHEAHLMAVSEIATAAAMTESAAGRLVDEAAELCGPQWAVLEALQAGDIGQAEVHVILDQARATPPEEAPHFGRNALLRTRTRTGRRRTPAELRSCLRTLRERLYPETIQTRKSTALQERGLWFTPEPDGMCTLTAHLPAEAGLAIYNGLDKAARAAARARVDGTLQQLRADALVSRVLGTRDAGSAEAFRAEVVVTIPLELALGAEEASNLQANAELEGYGPIDPATARRLTSLAENWHRIFTDTATGAALGVGRTSYRPPAALRRYLAHRDGGCTFPGCPCHSQSCEPDHTAEWQDGGSTDADNLALLCSKHHALKSIGAWAYEHTASDGSLTWRSPLGRTYTTEPDERQASGPPDRLPLEPEPPPPF